MPVSLEERKQYGCVCMDCYEQKVAIKGSIQQQVAAVSGSFNKILPSGLQGLINQSEYKHAMTEQEKRRYELRLMQLQLQLQQPAGRKHS
jgi:CII-binding regulator of phage lambda lysogenization HflD